MQDSFDYYPDLDRSRFIRHNPAFQEKIFGRSGLLPFWVADTDFRVMPELIEALQKRAAMGIFAYENPTPALREALAAWQQERYGTTLAADKILFTPSVNTSIAIIISLFSHAGDGIIVQPPVYSAFMHTIKSLDRQVVYNPLHETTEGYRMNLADLEELAARPQNKVMILCSPHNPTGRVWTDTELQETAAICQRHGVLLISDEIHVDIVYPPHRFVPTLRHYPEGKNIITVSSAGKSFGIPGLVSSWLYTPDRRLHAAIKRHINAYHLDKSNACSNTALETVYTRGHDWLAAMIDYLQGNIKLLQEYLPARIPGVRFRPPEGTYQVWLDMRELGLHNRELARFLAAEAGLALNPGHSYGPGGDGFARMNIASPRSLLRHALEQLQQAVATL